jgi:membrane protease YdiL (CAAX protease family)
MLVVISIQSLGGAFGTNAGFNTTITSPAGYYAGILSAALSLILLRIFKTPIWPMIAALGVGFGITCISYLLATDVGDGSAIVIGIPVGIIAATAMSGVFAATGITFSVVRFREPLSSLGFNKTSSLKPYLFAVAMWIVGLSVLMFWVQALVWFGVDVLVPPDTATQALDRANGSIIATILLVGIIGPMAEEIFFRGFVLPGLVKKFGIIWALVISSVVFGLFHIDPGTIVPTFTLGLALGWVYIKTGSIWPAMFAHGLHNTVAVLIAKYVTIS